MTYWKFLRPGMVSPFTGYVWAPGEWRTAGSASACRGGFHLLCPADLPYWVSDELWGAEVDGPVVPARRKVVAGRVRLVSQVAEWNPGTQQEFAQACVSRTMHYAQAELAVALAVPSGAPSHEHAMRQAVKLCGYVLDAASSVDAYPVATVAYIAARAAGQCTATELGSSYRAERAWQAEWLVDRLGLTQDSAMSDSPSDSPAT